MKLITHLFILTLFIVSCSPKNSKKERKNSVDEIFFDEKLDSKEFKPCLGDQNIIQYYYIGDGLAYKGGKIAIIEEVHKKYDTSTIKKESGLIRIRFIVNCKGETGRFRLMGMDENYKEKEFSEEITTQLMTITKNLKGWKIKTHKEQGRDYYQYLIFKLEEGKIVKILP